MSSQELKDLFFKRNFRTIVHWLTSKVQLRLAKAFNILHRSRLKIKRHSMFLFLLWTSLKQFIQIANNQTLTLWRHGELWLTFGCREYNGEYGGWIWKWIITVKVGLKGRQRYKHGENIGKPEITRNWAQKGQVSVNN